MTAAKYSIRCKQQVAIVHIRGSWGESITRQFVRDFKKQVESLLHSPWAQLVYFDEWQFSSPENEHYITRLLHW